MSETAEKKASPQANRDERIRMFIEIQLGKSAEGLGFARQQQLLQGKFKKAMIMMLLNLGFVLFFSLSFYYEITQLSTTWFNLILVFFIINVIFFAYQHRKIKEANAWLKEKIAEQ
ncbi:MAG: hypothetical protein JJU35_01245 [Balneolales bacterium]|nr:hypothetical protein [Balneolales bacterium]